jgi:hypothetical protein
MGCLRRFWVRRGGMRGGGIRGGGGGGRGGWGLVFLGGKGDFGRGFLDD